MKLRRYRAFWNDGHDTGEFEYYSSHRNYSKGNMEDMKSEYKKRYGYSEYKAVIKFSFGYLLED